MGRGAFGYAKTMKVKRSIIFVELPISAPHGTVFQGVSSDIHLKAAIRDYQKELEAQGIEIMDKRHNMMASREKYYFAVFEDEVQKHNN